MAALWAVGASAQVPEATRGVAASDAKLALEVGRLQLEVKRLEEQERWPDWVRSPWLQVGFAFLGGFVAASIAAGAAVYNARKARHAGYDEEVLGRRLDKYSEVVAATEALALYAPEQALTPLRCREMAAGLRRCYFAGVGVLLTTDARDRYFEFIEALVRAADAAQLDAPALADYARQVSVRSVDLYRHHLGLDLKQGSEPEGMRAESWVRSWQFGRVAGDPALHRAVRGSLAPRADGQWPAWPSFGDEFAHVENGERPTFARALLYRDFVFLQTLSSRLRTALADDLRGRRRLE